VPEPGGPSCTKLPTSCGNQPALDFYGMLGGVVVAQREDKRGEGIIFAEIAYGWASVASLATAAP